MIDIRKNEYKIYSQNGEDGIINYLLNKVQLINRTFIEIGCSDGQENNSRNLLNMGFEGIGVDSDWRKLVKYNSIVKEVKKTDKINLKCLKVNTNCVSEIISWYGVSPDFFSIDIDSIDYYVADGLLREGFRPSVVCVETNSFLGNEEITVEYLTNFSRYNLQPDYGLYFGASPNAWRYLWKSYGYISLGMDSSGTNMFFLLPERLKNIYEEIHESEDIHQKYFEKKYSKKGEELTDILLNTKNLKFINVKNKKYIDQFIEKNESKQRVHKKALFVTTFIKKTYDEVAINLIESFERHWPEDYQFLALTENCQVEFESSRIINMDLEETSIGLNEFKMRHRFNPGANGRFGDSYNYVFDAVKWSHKVFAVEAASIITNSEILIYIDSDIITFQNVPNTFLSEIIPEDTDIAYLPRKNMYSECSFVIYRLRNPYVRSFIFEHAEAYRKDAIFKLPGWTDCHIFDYLVKKYTHSNYLKFRDINEGVPISMHPFINGPLGKYMDHMKGARKKIGKSYNSDLVIDRNESYWKVN